MRILVIEDEIKVAALITAGLVEQGWAVEFCGNGDEGLRLATANNFDAVVLDIMLPGRDGLSLLRKLRGEHNPVPVSYTHLRAHETRHDLVCRLLLEKK